MSVDDAVKGHGIAEEEELAMDRFSGTPKVTVRRWEEKPLLEMLWLGLDSCLPGPLRLHEESSEMEESDSSEELIPSEGAPSQDIQPCTSANTSTLASPVRQLVGLSPDDSPLTGEHKQTLVAGAAVESLHRRAHSSPRSAQLDIDAEPWGTLLRRRTIKVQQQFCKVMEKMPRTQSTIAGRMEESNSIASGLVAQQTKGSARFEDTEHIDRKARGVWTTKADYILSMIGYAVGLGNVWRFPYLAYKNGGGAFVIPYVIMLAFVGLPVFFLECSLGQFASVGPIFMWKAVPILQGVGVTMVLVSTIVALYYNCIIGYSVYYLFASFQYPLPWSNCFDWWGADELCSSNQKDSFCSITLADGTIKIIKNETCTSGAKVYLAQNPSEQYWNKVVLRRSSSIDETGEIVWHLALCLLLAWLIVGVTLCKGIKSSGKVVYFTATFPYLVILVLLIRGVTLEGARNGIEYYIGKQSDFSKLAHAEVWKDAATQIFYSLTVAFGGITALSSYSRFNNNCYRDAIVVCIVDCSTSILAGFAIFSVLGHMAYLQDKSVKDVAESGFGLVFIAYPDALSHLPKSPLWSVLFFFMLITLGIDSEFALMETVATSIQDAFPNFVKPRYLCMLMILGISMYLLGLVFVTQAGIYWMHIIDHFSAGLILLLNAALEVIGIIWIYGGNRFIKDIEMMIGEKSWRFWLWWRSCWFCITPFLTIGILIWSLITFVPPHYGPIEYPSWAIALGWCILLFCVLWIPLLAIKKIAQSEGSTLYQKFVASCRPAPDWGPFLKVDRGERYKNQID
ncbi:sodium- and chloride-dependent neutral and basic amino acid transporter B(0+)-like [Heptranchias perlo]|uniref:sodium- and chloride-dependent neutral and basic amino acid transporter B(0+)-like n=1 Tax=Heptranchias perlo TaxID=212740 RepID=UPI00355A2092